MSDRRWVDELPRDSAARQLLVASKKVRSPVGSVDRGWKALSVTLGTATTMATLTTKAFANVVTESTAASTTAASTTAASTTAASTTAASTAAASTAAASTAAASTAAASTTAASTAPVIAGSVFTAKASFVSLIGLFNAKLVTASILVGVGALGTQALITKGMPRAGVVRGPTTILSSTVPRGSASPPVTVLFGSASPSVVDQVHPPEVRVISEALTATPTPPGTAEKPDTLGPVVVTTPIVKASRGSVLTKQAQEIARVKHLIDTGSSTAAISRLEASLQNNEYSAFSEERDALYVDALESSGRKTQAKRRAARFILKYPKSPHVEKMRQLVRSE